MSDMKCLIKCPMCGEILQKYGEIDPNAGTSIVLGANCPKCGIGNSDIKLWQELIRTRKALDVAVDGLLAVWRATEHTTKQGSIAYNVLCDLNIKPLDRIKALEQKD